MLATCLPTPCSFGKTRYAMAQSVSINNTFLVYLSDMTNEIRLLKITLPLCYCSELPSQNSDIHTSIHVFGIVTL